MDTNKLEDKIEFLCRDTIDLHVESMGKPGWREDLASHIARRVTALVSNQRNEEPQQTTDTKDD